MGNVVRCEPPGLELPLDRDRLACLPGQPDPWTPLLCLDTETTGLGTAAGTVVFLVGLGWWEGTRLRIVQLLLPDQADEPALLTALEAAIPRAACLVSYNGRAFDWPLIVNRYRMLRRQPPVVTGHLDLLPTVRRLFRHRLENASLRSVERGLLGVERHSDVDGWEIPGRYLGFLQGGSAEPLRLVGRHNAEDVRSLGRLLAHLDRRYADEAARATAPAPDLLGLSRAFRGEGRLRQALACLDLALGNADGCRTRSLVGAERARTLRRLERHEDARAAWASVAGEGGPAAARAWIELAKIAEHRDRDPRAALAATERARALLDRARLAGEHHPLLETDLTHRTLRLRHRLGRPGGRRRQWAAGSRRAAAVSPRRAELRAAS